MSISSVLLAMPFLTGVLAAQDPNLCVPPRHATLSSLRDSYRALLIFAPNDRDARLEQQIQLTDDARPALAERQVVRIAFFEHGTRAIGATAFYPDGSLGYLTLPEAAAARRRFHVAPGGFTVILVGKDGGEKLRAYAPIPYETLRDTIDAMPMRQDEMRHPQ